MPPMTVPCETTTSARVSATLRARRIPAEPLMRALGVSRQAVSDRMVGRTRWSANELPAVARVLGVSLPELAGLVEVDQ